MKSNSRQNIERCVLPFHFITIQMSCSLQKSSLYDILKTEQIFGFQSFSLYGGGEPMAQKKQKKPQKKQERAKWWIWILAAALCLFLGREIYEIPQVAQQIQQALPTEGSLTGDSSEIGRASCRERV